MPDGPFVEPLVLAPRAEARRNRLAAMIGQIETVGPNMSEVARRLDWPKDRARYLFRAGLEKRGYVVNARPNMGALGLREFVALVDIEEKYAPWAGDVFDGLDGRSFIFGYSRTLPDGKYVIHFAIPEDYRDQFPSLLNDMKKVGFVAKVHLTMRFAWRGHLPMRAELFDFKKDRWDVDWTHLVSNDGLKIPKRIQRQRIDSIDIAILYSLITNASTPLKEIAKQLRVSSKTACHHADHIEERHMIQWYRVNWMKNHMSLELGRPFVPKHKFAFTYVCVLGPTSAEAAALRERLGGLPFVWFETGDPDYLAELAIPLDEMVETMSYLRETIKPVLAKTTWFMTDPACSHGYAPPRFFVDDSRGEWVFDLNAQRAALEGQLEIVSREHRLDKGDTQMTSPPRSSE